MNHNGNGKLVLVVDDSPTQSIQMQHLLETNGLRCNLAADGQAGLELARSTQPDAIILDLEMPHMNGLQVCQQLKADRKTSKIPVILMTRHNESVVQILGLELGAVEFIPKDNLANFVLISTLKGMHLITSEKLDR